MVLVTAVSLIGLCFETASTFLGIRSAPGRELLIMTGTRKVEVVVDQFESETERPTWFDVSPNGDFVSVIVAGRNVRITQMTGTPKAIAQTVFGNGNIVMPKWQNNSCLRFGSALTEMQIDGSVNVKVAVFEMAPPKFVPKQIGVATSFPELTRKYFRVPSDIAKLALPNVDYERFQFDAELAGVGPWSDPIQIDLKAKLTLIAKPGGNGKLETKLLAYDWPKQKLITIRAVPGVPRFLRLNSNGWVSYTLIDNEISDASHGVSGPRSGYSDAFDAGTLREQPTSFITNVISGKTVVLKGVASAIPFNRGS